MNDAAPPSKAPLLLHICCAPCATHTVEVLRVDFEVTGYFYGPNIHPEDEYRRRLAAMDRLAEAVDLPYYSGPYDTAAWLAATKGLELEPEGGERCTRCFELRLESTAREAAAKGIPWFAATLTISPHKDARRINAIGERAARDHGVRFLSADFKKKDGFRKSVDLSARHGLYRQRTCGCGPSAFDQRKKKGDR